MGVERRIDGMPSSVKGAIVVPCFCEQECIEDSYQKLKKKLGTLSLSMDSRIIFVDDGSTDDTWSKLAHIAERDNQVVAIKLSHNVGHQNALMAGLSYAVNKFDFTITIDADLQQDIECMDEFLESYLENNSDIVFGIRNSRKTDGFIKKITALGFYSLLRGFGTEIIPNHADYRLLSDKANRALQQYGEVNLFLRGIVTQLGFKTDTVFFNVKNREAGYSKYTGKKMMKLALDGITSFSVVPLRIIFLLGIFVTFMSACLLAWIFYSFINGETIQGWASMLCSMWFLGGCILFSIGICGEYIGKAYMETKHRPRFIVDTIIS